MNPVLRAVRVLPLLVTPQTAEGSITKGWIFSGLPEMNGVSRAIAVGSSQASRIGAEGRLMNGAWELRPV
jgi:hypothetical protein